MHNLQGKRAFLTGAASGIGRAISIELARAGTHLFLVDVDEGGLTDVAAQALELGVDVHDEVCDLTDRRQISRAIQRALTRGPIDLLVNNAGVAFYGPTETMSEQQWDQLLNVNLLAPVHITRELLPQLLSRPDSHLVNMCSISGLVAGGRFAAYHVSKFGLVGFTEGCGPIRPSWPWRHCRLSRPLAHQSLQFSLVRPPGPPGSRAPRMALCVTRANCPQDSPCHSSQPTHGASHSTGTRTLQPQTIRAGTDRLRKHAEP